MTTSTICGFQYSPIDQEFHSALLPPIPLSSRLLQIRYEHPTHPPMRISGFYDGNQTWRVRFTPPVCGTWRYTAISETLTDLHDQTGTIEVAPPNPVGPLSEHGGILKVSQNSRYLTYTDGTPFFWLGDTWWTCPSDSMPIDHSNREGISSMYLHLLEVRRRQGFTILHMAFLGSIGTTTLDSFLKTQGPDDFDSHYWQTADRYVQAANAAGMIPAIALGWVNFNSANLDAWKQLWSYVVSRYGAYAVTWLVCGEYNIATEGPAPERVAHALAMGQHIHDEDPYARAMTIHPWYYLGDRHQAWKEPWYGFTLFQGGHNGSDQTPPSSHYFDGYDNQPTRPVIEGETNYESILMEPVTAQGVRRSAYHALQCGACGFTYGAQGLWYPTQNEQDTTFSNWGRPNPWWKAIEMPGANQMGYMRQCYESVAWWKLEPWPNALAFDGGARDGARPYVKGTQSPFTALIYFPTGFSRNAAVILKLPAPTSTLETVWFNPRDGVFQPPAPVSGRTETILWLPARPDGNDWMLILREVQKPPV